MDALVFVLDRYGFPAAIALVVLWWVGRKLLEPLVLRHGKFLDDTARAHRGLVKAYKRMARACESHSDALLRLPCIQPASEGDGQIVVQVDPSCPLEPARAGPDQANAPR